MKRLIIWLALLLPFIANAQVNGTIQKTASSGTIRGSFGSLGIDTIPRVTGALVNGYILKYHAATNKWYASPDPTLVGLQDSLTKKANRTFDNVASGAIAKAKVDTSGTGLQTVSNFFPKGDTRYAKIGDIPTLGTSAISLGGTANGLSYSGGNYRLHKVTATTGGVLTTGNDTIGGNKFFNGKITSNLTSAFFLASLGAGTGGSGMELNNTGGHSRFGIEGSIGNTFFSSATAYATVFGTQNNTPIEFYTNNTKRLTIANSGGISATGTISSTPQGTLYGTASGSITSAQLATSLTDETGTGNVVFSANPTFTGTIAAAAAGFTGAVNLATSSGNVLIGTTTDDGYKLDVNGTARFSGLVTGNGGFRSTAYQLFQASAQRGGLYTYDAIAGSGTDYNPTFYSEGDLYFATGGTATKKLIISSAGAATFSSSVTATGFFESSDLRYKDILSRAVSKDGFDMISYKWKSELNRDNKVHFGYVAQEVEKVYPDQVQTDEKGFKSVNYIEILVKKVHDLEQRIKQLEK